MKMSAYILGLDQSTQGTKAILFDEAGNIARRLDRAHKQYINAQGWVGHDAAEIWQNVRALVREIAAELPYHGAEIQALGISNQRETAVAWHRETGEPCCHAIVWQCPRAQQICKNLSAQATEIQELTGLPLSPYFSAAKFAWLLQNDVQVQKLQTEGKLAFGTMDAYLAFRLTNGAVFATDVSNASRTQLMNLQTCKWSKRLLEIFGVEEFCLPAIRDSDAGFGETDVAGILPKKIPILAMLGDSQAALFGQGAHEKGQTKTTYGTGSSVMMHIGNAPVQSAHRLAVSVGYAWQGRKAYVLEGNIHYTGGAVRWLAESFGFIHHASEIETLAQQANPVDKSVFVPAFTGLGAPYWSNEATGLWTGLTRTTGRAELARAVLMSIPCQIAAVMKAMQKDAGLSVSVLRADGGATKNKLLMQWQADLLHVPVHVAQTEELSAMGAAYMAGIACGLYDAHTIFTQVRREAFLPKMQVTERQEILSRWQRAVTLAMEAAKNEREGQAYV